MKITNEIINESFSYQPHFKLIRDDSDLRVYFWWQDDEVGDGKKVLIGRVGRHPWRKGH